ncbi:MAG TPA: peptide chain release factor-like protein [Tepidisphaeraceae bacterium]|nr:peptide chain release factor-like protein [Tepidisphaeraceae bacterium]
MDTPPPGGTETPPWELSDPDLVAQCRFEAYVASGPGGQKRNKTNAAVRYTHLPTRTVAVETSSRSQRENKIYALRTLRHKLAMNIRRDLDPLTFRPPLWLAEYPGLHINPKNPRYPSVVAIVLDVLKAMRWSPSGAAATLGVSSSALNRFLFDDPALWTHVNEVRRQLGMKPLVHR